MRNELEEIKRLISAGDLQSAIDKLKAATRNIPGFELQILQLQARLSNYNKALTGGLIKALSEELNAIIYGLLSLVVQAGATENQSEDAILKNVGETLLLTPVQGEKSALHFKRFRTGEVFEMQVSLDMNTRELKNRLIPAAMPAYLRSPAMQEVFGFQLMLLRTGEVLDDARPLRENGLQPGDTVYLRKYFFDAVDDLGAVAEEAAEEMDDDMN